MFKKVEEIKGTISRIGLLIGPTRGIGPLLCDRFVEIQFMLENNKNVYIIFAGPMIGLTKIGDEVRFNMKHMLFAAHEHDVNDTSFINVTLNTELGCN